MSLMEVTSKRKHTDGFESFSLTNVPIIIQIRHSKKCRQFSTLNLYREQRFDYRLCVLSQVRIVS